MTTRLTVVAFGGNAMLLPGEAGSPREQIANARTACAPLVELLRRGERLVLVHGNGPQVGRELDRGFLARTKITPMPLDACVAATQGTMGYFLELALRQALRQARLDARIATLASLVRVDADDPAFATPDKPVGDAGQGPRKVVASPMPREILDLRAIRALVASDHLVIACGGGGVPVVVGDDGDLVGIEAVIDKDHTASLLGRLLEARELIDLTNVDFVYRDFGRASQTPLSHLSLPVARRMAAEGQFPPGSMGPKIEAACAFVEAGGDSVLISSMAKLDAALRGEVGTRITRT
jgi:carbamate kinase